VERLPDTHVRAYVHREVIVGDKRKQMQFWMGGIIGVCSFYYFREVLVFTPFLWVFVDISSFLIKFFL
jgi:hypothetical protein